MRFAIVATVSENGIPTEYVPIVSADLAAAVLARLPDHLRAACEGALHDAFDAEEKAVRTATVHLDRGHE